jgi:hypothetical protein
MIKSNKIVNIFLALILPIILIIAILVFLDKPTSLQSKLSFDDLMTVKDINETIQLFYLPHMTNQSEGKIYDIQLKNYSENRVEFQVNYGMRIFIDQGIQGGWTEIKNDVNYFGPAQGDNPILAAKGNDLAQTVITTVPAIPMDGEPVKLRFFVTGNVLSFLSIPGKLVEAYVDITVQP